MIDESILRTFHPGHEVVLSQDVERWIKDTLTKISEGTIVKITTTVSPIMVDWNGKQFAVTRDMLREIVLQTAVAA